MLRTAKIVSLVLLMVIVLFIINITLGSVSIPITETFKLLSGKGCSDVIYENILLRTRLPQTITATMAGVALGISGLFMQTLFRNPLAGPSVLGISSGASLGVAFVILVAGQVFGFSFAQLGIWGDLSVTLFALAGSLGILLLILSISQKIGGTLGVLIIGVMLGYLANSLVGVFKFFSLEEDVHSYVIWGLGSFSRLSLERSLWFSLMILPVSALGILMTKPLNLLSLGDRYAQNLGLKTKRARIQCIILAGVLTAITTAYCGPIVFIGVAVPHLAKMILRTSNHLNLIIVSAIMGAATTLLCNIVARMPGLDIALPINSVAAFIGAPVVISVIWKRRKDQLLSE